jgi:LysM repeat protein
VLLVAAAVLVGGLVAPTLVPTAAADGTYVVQPGDYLYGIAQRQGVSVEALLAANGLTLGSVIHPGQRLVVPGGRTAVSAPSGRTYTVRSGDYLIGIARRLGVPTRSLLAANGLTLGSVIHPGQKLRVPAGGRQPAPPSRPTPPPDASPTVASRASVERIIRAVWPDALEGRALAIAWRESNLQPNAQSECCAGLFQIYYDVHKGWLAALGIDSRSDLSDPRTNAVAAYALYRRAGGWGPWSLPGA